MAAYLPERSTCVFFRIILTDHLSFKRADHTPITDKILVCIIDYRERRSVNEMGIPFYPAGNNWKIPREMGITEIIKGDLLRHSPNENIPENKKLFTILIALKDRESKFW